VWVNSEVLCLDDELLDLLDGVRYLEERLFLK
jgi:hypothetical protein